MTEPHQKIAYEATFQAFDEVRGHERDASFIVLAPDLIEAKRLAVHACINAGIDYNNMEVTAYEKKRRARQPLPWGAPAPLGAA